MEIVVHILHADKKVYSSNCHGEMCIHVYGSYISRYEAEHHCCSAGSITTLQLDHGGDSGLTDWTRDEHGFPGPYHVHTTS